MAVAGLVAGGVAVFIVPILLVIFGFTYCGVRILSCAACWQSSVGDVESGSCFSCLQSVAANWCQCKSIGLFLLLGLVVGTTTGFVVLETTDVEYFDMDHAMTSGAESLGKSPSCLCHVNQVVLISGYFPTFITALLFAAYFNI